MLFEQLAVGARRRRELSAGDAGHDLAQNGGVIFRFVLSLGTFDAESRKILAQPRQRALVQEAGDIIGAVGHQFAAADADAPDEPIPPTLSRVILSAQEDLRREIARSMHDGPAQSLTNIVLQSQIVDRLLERDPAVARGELKLLVQMVQQTLDATKNFIFDVRPMVLDDLGLVPTLRRATREGTLARAG